MFIGLSNELMESGGEYNLTKSSRNLILTAREKRNKAICAWKTKLANREPAFYWNNEKSFHCLYTFKYNKTIEPADSQGQTGALYLTPQF